MTNDTTDVDGDGDALAPCDLTLAEAAALCGSTDHEKPDLDALEFDGPPELAVAASFEDIHPAVAAQMLRRIIAGLDDGFTIQGADHPDFQRVLAGATTDAV